MTALFDVEVSRTIDAAPERVFRAWTEPTLFGRWFEAIACEMDVREGGLFFIEVEDRGRKWAHYGRYLEIDPPRRIVFTWMSEATRGIETIVTVELTPVAGGRTELSLKHPGLPDTELARGHEEGWQSLLDTVDPIVALIDEGATT